MCRLFKAKVFLNYIDANEDLKRNPMKIETHQSLMFFLDSYSLQINNANLTIIKLGLNDLFVRPGGVQCGIFVKISLNKFFL